ncbi:unnamed protein product [Caenorhabditis auriculariae]|uniref:Uncharacterized protein n=1 Tax=Caenorhabditis auriculariae TaxID=2777116 RepID=A0A8S1H073_9PELO|nr:unnamed protein product [Caenorhabditis auriculariae]
MILFPSELPQFHHKKRDLRTNAGNHRNPSVDSRARRGTTAVMSSDGPTDNFDMRSSDVGEPVFLCLNTERRGTRRIICREPSTVNNFDYNRRGSC